MIRFLLRRTINGALVLFGVVSVVFLIFNLKPGDPARMLADQRGNAEALEAIRKDLGYDLSLGKRYMLYLNDLSPVSLHTTGSVDAPFYLDYSRYHVLLEVPLGSKAMVVKTPYLRRSYRSRRDVASMLGEAFPTTAVLAVVAMILAVAIGLALGTVAALRKGTAPDALIVGMSAVGMSGPSFFMAVLIAWLGGFVWYESIPLPWPLIATPLIAIGYHLWRDQRQGRPRVKVRNALIRGIFTGLGIGVVIALFGWIFGAPWLTAGLSLPGTGSNMSGSLVDLDPFRGPFFNWQNLILPAITLGIRPLAVIVQLTRSSLLEVLSQDHVRTARAKGLSERSVVLRHGLRNALMPVLTAVSGWFASLLAGAVFVEYVFGWKGLGLEVFIALENEDLPVVMGAVLLFATIFVVINVLVDLLYGVLDPRVREQ